MSLIYCGIVILLASCIYYTPVPCIVLSLVISLYVRIHPTSLQIYMFLRPTVGVLIHTASTTRTTRTTWY